MPLLKGKSEGAFKHNLKAEIAAGKPMKQSLAIAYAMKKKEKKMAEGGKVAEAEQEKPIGEIINYPGMPHPKPSNKMAHGGDIVDHIMMKKYSEGGRVANGGEDEMSHLADSDPNEFGDLALDDHLESHNSAASDGDMLGDEQEDHDRHDIVARVMRQRSMKQRNPRPA